MPTPEITTIQQEIALLRPRSQAAALSPRPRSRTGLRTLLLALTTGGLLWLCYFPVAWGWLGWLALVPLLALVRSSARPWTIYLSAWAGGLLFCMSAMHWLRVADPRMYFTWIFLATYCSWYFPLALYLIRFLERRTSLPLVLTAPIVWTALEFCRSFLITGFPWYLLGHTQHRLLPLIQIADLTGAFGVSFLVVAVNALLFEVLWGRRWFRGWVSGHDSLPLWGRLGLLVQSLAILAALLGSAAYGFWRLGQDRMTPGPRLALVQGNLDQRIRNDSAVHEDAAERVERHFLELSDLASYYRPDLIVWPETSYPYDWVEKADGTPTHRTGDMVREMAARWHTNVLVGMNAANLDEDDRPHRYNSAVLVERSGQPGGRYDKMHRVPFGEYVPLRDWLPWMNALRALRFRLQRLARTQFHTLPARRSSLGPTLHLRRPHLLRGYRPGTGSALRWRRWRETRRFPAQHLQ